MKWLALALLLLQNPPAAKPVGPNPEELAREWFIRLNELDDWYISYDTSVGK